MIKKRLFKGGCSVEVSGSDGKRVLWGVVDDHVVEEEKEHDEIGLQRFYLIYFEKCYKGVVTERLSE